MNDTQNEKFKFVNFHDPSQADQLSTYNPKNRFAQFDAYFHSNAIFSNLSWNSHQLMPIQASKSKDILDNQQDIQKDKKIKKLTKVNKHLLEKLKQLNDELTKKLEKQKLRIPKKSVSKNKPKNQQQMKEIQGAKKQLQNAYNQIDFYKQTISLLKAQQLPASEQDKIIDQNDRLRKKNEDIEKIQHQIKVQKAIKAHQEKQFSKVKNLEMTEVLNKLDEEIINSKTKLKEVKKNFVKKEQLEKKQHMYFRELQALLKKTKNSQDQNQQQNYLQSSLKITQFEQQVPQLKWEEAKIKLAQQRKKYQQNGKKITYHNYLKSKLAKSYEELDLKYKQKSKVLQKLNSKMNEVNKLVRLKPKIQISQKVNLKMQKLKDIIERQSTVELNKINKIKARSQSQDVRQFKKWEIQHALRQDEVEQNISKIKFKPQSQESLHRNQFEIILSPQKYQLKA